MSVSTIRRPPRVWEIRPQDPEAAAAITASTGLCSAAARVMAARGWKDAQAVRDFLSNGLSVLSDPFELPDMEVALARIRAAIDGGESICIYGDYDVDGTTATALLVRTMRWLGVENVRSQTPHRIKEGYGIKREAVETLAKEGVRLIVTVDNGTTATDALECARDLGVDVIVTDHHQVDGPLPPAVAIVNPWREDSTCSFRDLCGCALAFKLAQAMVKESGRDAEEAKTFLTELIELVAVATIADVMPLHGENRAVVRFGLRQLPETKNHGLRALIDSARLGRDLTASNIGWVIGPRLNAAGRTSHSKHVVDLLTTEDADHARHLAQMLEKLNAERRQIESAIVEQAMEELEVHIDDPVIVLARPGWHLGVLGIVASRVLDRTERPAILMAVEKDVARGSGRSIPGFDMHAALCACADQLIGFGGHPMAAGVTCDPAKIDDFRQALIAHAQSLPPEALAPRTRLIDTELVSSEISEETIEHLHHLEPYGEAHPEPLFAIRGLKLEGPPRVLKEKHLKMRFSLPDGRSLLGICWRSVDRLGELMPTPACVDIVGRPTLNEWRGQRTVEFEIIDWQVHHEEHR